MYGKVTKNIKKSLRLTEEAYNYINSFSGDSFQESFDNMVSYFEKEQPKRKRQLENLDKEIERKNKELAQRREFINDTLDIVDLCQEFTYAATLLRQEVNKFLKINKSNKPQDMPFGSNTT